MSYSKSSKREREREEVFKIQQDTAILGFHILQAKERRSDGAREGAMHAVPRSDKHKYQAPAALKRAALYAKLVNATLQRVRAHIEEGRKCGEEGGEGEGKDKKKEEEEEREEKILDMTKTVLEVNCENYYMWSVRKMIVLDKRKRKRKQKEKEKEEQTGAGDDDEEDKGEEEDALVRAEMELSEAALRRNAKSYGAWYHRQWTLSLDKSETLLRKELDLVAQLLLLDARNFHAWNHRRSVCSMLSRKDVVNGAAATRCDELAFCGKMVARDFSNYSAWHYRSALMTVGANTKPMQTMHAEADEGPVSGSSSSAAALVTASGAVQLDLETLRREFALVQQALHTEPSDQSGWFYHGWLVACALRLPHDSTEDKNLRREILNTEANAMRWIVREERKLLGDTSTIGSSGTLNPRVLRRLRYPLLSLVSLLGVGADAEEGESALHMYDELITIDPMRKGMYASKIQELNARESLEIQR